jgi:serine/threonine protein kinase
MGSEGRRWHLLERLGSGAFGEVYLAEQDSGAGFRRRVALKLLHPQVASIPEAGRRMRDEARILGRLQHRHIVTVLDLVRLGEQWAIVMDHIPGVDLDRVLEALEKTDERMPAPAAFAVGAAVAEAMDAAFMAEDGKGGTLGVVHRDIKPSNVLVTKDGDVKVLDFGVARVNLDTRESRTGLRVGTERYMSPQRICGEEDDLAGDVYALGATIAELVQRTPIGRTPVEETKHAAFVESTLAELRPLLDGPRDAVDRAIDLVGRSLDNDPAKRPTPREMADGFTELSRQLRGDALPAFARAFVPRVDEIVGRAREPVTGTLSERSFDRTSGGGSGVSVAPAKTPPPENATFPVDQEPSRSRLPLIVMAGAALFVALLVVGGFGLAFVISQSGSEPEVTTEVEPEPKPAEPAPVDPGLEARGHEEKPEVAVVAEPAPAVAAEAAATEAPAATIRPKPKPKAAATVAPVDPPPVAADAPRVSRALIVAPDASAVEVRCGDRSATGTASARITDFPAGSCTVKITRLGRELTTTVAVDRPREVACSATGDVLSCS